MMPQSATTGRRAAAPATEVRRTTAHTILSRAVCLTIERHYFGNYRKVKTEKVVEAAGGQLVDAEGKAKVDAQQLNTTKRLVDSSVLTPPMRVIGQMNDYLKAKAISSHRVFGEGTFLIPVALVEEIDKELRRYERELRKEAKALAEKWQAAIEEQKAKLGPLFNLADYPTAAEVEAAYGFDWSYVSFAAPEKLEHVNRALFEGAQTKFQRKMETAYEEVRLVLRETLRQLVGEIVKKLEPGPDGKTKTFRNTVLDGLADFLRDFDVRNIADDGELTTVVRKLKSLTHGLDPDQLRELEDLRGKVLGDMKAATEKLDAMIATGRRGITFGKLKPSE